MSKPHWTVTEVMERWQCTRDSVLSKIHGGQLHAINVGKSQVKPRWRIPHDSLETYELANSSPAWNSPPKATRSKKRTHVKEFV